MDKNADARDSAARAKRNQEMASDLITRVENAQAKQKAAKEQEQ